jgi:GT2 family glycosyltransferase
MVSASTFPFISIIIPTGRDYSVLSKCLATLLAQDYPKDKFEIILISQAPIDTGKITAGYEKKILCISGVNFGDARNVGASKAQGSFLAFVDDDCLVPRDWLIKAMDSFTHPRIAVVGGPALPFREDAFAYRMGGYLFASPFAVGFASARYRRVSGPRETGEENLLTANTIIRREAFKEVGGFDARQVRSEDSDLYFRIKQKGWRLLYVPDVFVWHRSKPIFWPIITKVFYYAVGRATLMMRKPQTMRPMYFIPSIAALGFIAMVILAIFSPFIRIFFALALILYLGVGIAHACYVYLRFEHTWKGAIAVFVTIPIIHFSYGFGILAGIYKYVLSQEVRVWKKNDHT